MAYQLRFLKSNPIGAWLSQTANILEIIIPPNTWLASGPISERQNFRRVRRALAGGLSSFLVKKSMCDLDLDHCDEGLVPAPGNKSPDRFEENTVQGPVKRYMFREGTDLRGAVEKITEALFQELPEASWEREKVAGIVRESIASHLFENPRCFHRAICRHSHNMDMAKDLADPKPREDFIPSLKAQL
jgi:hypothetical protein